MVGADAVVVVIGTVGVIAVVVGGAVVVVVAVVGDVVVAVVIDSQKMRKRVGQRGVVEVSLCRRSKTVLLLPAWKLE